MTVRKIWKIFIGFYILAYFPDCWLKYLEWNNGIIVDFSLPNPWMAYSPWLRDTYNFLYDTMQLGSLYLLLSNLKYIKKYDFFVFICFPFLIVVEIYILNRFDHWLVFRGLEWGTRDIPFILILLFLAKETPASCQRIKFYFIIFSGVVTANFLLIFHKKGLPVILQWSYLANNPNPLQAHITLSVILILAIALWFWIRPVVGISNLKTYPFDPSKNSLLIRPPSEEWKFLFLDFSFLKEGASIVYLKKSREFYGLKKKTGWKKGRFGIIPPDQINIEKMTCVPFRDFTSYENSNVQKVINQCNSTPSDISQGCSYSLFFFTCWHATDMILHAGVGHGYRKLLKRNRK